MSNDPLFDAEMPARWQRTAYLIRGLAFGFLLGYLFSLLVSPSEFGLGPILIVVAASLAIAVLASLPKAWIEQCNRLRAARDGTLMEDVEKRR